VAFSVGTGVKSVAGILVAGDAVGLSVSDGVGTDVGIDVE
jgi:hypothetical protein